MTLQPGAKLGPYELLEQIGEGGMGEVWRARDTRLGRDVALKVSKTEFTERFSREAHLVAQLNHPHICTLHDVGPNYLVMEFIDGVPIRGPLPVAKAVECAGQILDALDAAHRKGIIHCDLKPANILLTKQGIKLLDFGLAKQALSLKGDAPTVAALSVEGQISGTLQYMAPEQLQGKEADARSDIFSFGCVLYEMLSGRRAFGGASAASVIASILEREPEPLKTTPPLDRVFKTCLEKNPDARFQNALDLKRDLLWATEAPASARPPKARTTGIAIATMAMFIAAALAFIQFREKPAPTPVIRTTMLAPESTILTPFSASVSPDGTRIAFATSTGEGKTQLWVRPLDAIAAQPLAGTEGGTNPFWSPDGRSLGFIADRKLKRIDAAGGPVLTITDVGYSNESFRGASWNAHGDIVFYAMGQGLRKISTSGGTPGDATKFGPQETTHRWPWFLPDGVHFLFAAGANTSPAPKNIRLGSLTTLESTPLVEGVDSGAIYSAGHLLFLRGNTLMAQPFDVGHLKISGEAVPVAGNVPGGGVPTRGAFSASLQGLLVYSSGAGLSDLVWFDRKGNRIGVLGEPRVSSALTFSPDRSMLAVRVQEEARLSTWLMDVTRGLRTRLTSEGSDGSAAWSPDGRTVIFQWNRNGEHNIYRKSANGSGAEDLLYADNLFKDVCSISPDGKYLLYSVSNESAKTNGLWILPEPLGAAGAAKPWPLFQPPAGEICGQFAPDGRWIAYASNESGRSEVYVTPFPGPGGKRQITAAGGTRPRWRADGKEIFYLVPNGPLMTAELTMKNGALDTGETHTLFTQRWEDAPGYRYDVSADGQRVLFVTPRQNAVEGLTIVQNWPAGLKR